MTRAHTPARIIEELEASTRFRLDQAAREGAALRGELGPQAQILALSEVYKRLKAAGKLDEARAVKAQAYAIYEAMQQQQEETTMQPTDSYTAQALEEFVLDTQNLLDAAQQQEAPDTEEIRYWRAQRNAFVKAQTYFLQGVRLTETPSGYTVPSASRPGSLIHRCTKAGGVWICSCEAGDRGIFHWHTALIHAYERGAELEALAEHEAELRLHRRVAEARARLTCERYSRTAA